MPVGDGTNGLFGRCAFWGALVYVLTVPLEGLLHLGPLGTLAKGGGAVMLAATIFAFLAGALRVRRTDASVLFFAAFVGWAVLSYFWSGDETLTLARTVTNLQLLAVTVVLWQYVSTSERLRVVLHTYVVGTFIGSAYALVVRQPQRHGVARYSIGGPNAFGVEVCFALLAAFWLFNQTDAKWTRRFYIAFLPVGVLEVFSTASRTALVVLAMAVLFAVAERRFMQPRYIAAAIAVTGIVGFVVVHVVSSRQLQRLGTVSSAATSGLNGRTTQWRLAIDTFTSHPIEGLGASVFRDYSAAQIGISRVAHNTFLGVAADLGIVGLVLFVAAFVYAARGLPRLPPFTRRLWLGLLAVWFVGAMTLTWENEKFTYLVLVLVAAQSALAIGRAPTPQIPVGAERSG